jgi:hypothetical protein
MPITATVPQSANFAPKASITEGLHQVVVFKVEDLGLVPLSETIIAKNRAQRAKEGGDPNSVKTAALKARVFFNNARAGSFPMITRLSLHEKSALSRDLKRIGKNFDQTFDLETLVGSQAQLMAEEAVSQRGTKYVKIATLAKPAQGQKVKPLTDVPATARRRRRPPASLPQRRAWKSLTKIFRFNRRNVAPWPITEPAGAAKSSRQFLSLLKDYECPKASNRRT